MGKIFVDSQINIAKNADMGTNTPEYDGYLVTPSDSVDLPNGPCDAIVCFTAGGDVAVQLVLADDAGAVTRLATTTLKTLATGKILPICVSRILTTNTTGTGIYALYRK